MPECCYVLDCKQDSIFSYEDIYISKRYSDIEGGFQLLENIISESKEEEDLDIYIIIHEFLSFYVFEDSDRFIAIIKKLLQTPRIHVICTASAYEGLTPEILSLFSHRISLFLGDSSISNMLFNDDIACSMLMDWQLIFSDNYGKTYSIEDCTSTDEDNENNIDSLLDI